MIKRRIINMYILVFLLVIIISFLILYIFNLKAMPIIINYADVQTKKVGIEVLKETGVKEINELVKKNELFDIVCNDKGEIETIDFDTILVNEILLIASKNIRARLSEVENGRNLPKELYYDLSFDKLKNGIIYEVPFNVIFNNSFFYNIGPKIPIKIKYSGNVSLDIKTRVSEYGINSALIEIYIKAQVTQRTILPFKSKDVKLVSEIPVVMKVVKGNIPNYYNLQTK